VTTIVQPALPGIFVPAHAVTAAAAAVCDHTAGPCPPCVVLAAQALAAGLSAIDPSFAVDGHVLVIGADRWTLQHPLGCRPNLAACPVHADVDALDVEVLLDYDLGPHPVTVVDGQLLIDGRNPDGLDGDDDSGDDDD
jgi:hypothetical protein